MKKPFQKAGPDRTQRLRRWFQLVFLALNVWIGVQFYYWVRFYETGGQSPAVSRPPGVEGWLPIASLMNLKAWLHTGDLNSIHPAGVFLLIAFLAMSWLVRKSFCSWLCPVGTLSQYLYQLGQKMFRRNFRPPRWLDLTLRSLKYVLMALFLYVIAAMSVDDIRAFLGGPYGVVADVKMLNFFRTLSVAGLLVLALLVALSVLVKNFWCRYLCPYGGLLGLLGMIGPLRIKRDVVLCIDCAKCAKACPSGLAVDKLVSIHSAECTGCLNCVAVCPVQDSLYMSVAGRRKLPVWAMAGGIAAIFLAPVAIAHWTGHWHTVLPETVYRDLVPRANEFSHP